MKFRNTLRNTYNKIRDTFADCYTSNLFFSLSLSLSLFERGISRYGELCKRMVLGVMALH